MKSLQNFVLAVSLLAIAAMTVRSTKGDFVISLGNEAILANTSNQVVSVFGTFVNGTNNNPNIGGLQLNVRLSDGLGNLGSAAVFQGSPNENSQAGIQFLGGTIWDGAEAKDIVGSAPVDIDLNTNNGPSDVFPQYGSMGIGFVSNANLRTLSATPSLIAKLVIDTTGYSGPVDITLDDGTLGQSFFLSTTDQDLSSITQVVNRISAVPEPTSILFAISGVGAFIAYRRRKNACH